MRDFVCDERGERRLLLLDSGKPPAASRTAVADAIASVGTARQVGRRSQGALVGSFPSAKMRTAFDFESSVELETLLLADVLETVRIYRPQAMRIRFQYGGKLCTAFPDIAVVRVDGSVEFWECKTDGRLDDRRLARLRSLRDALARSGIGYRVRQPGWSRRWPVASNAKVVRRYAFSAVRERVRVAARAALRDGALTLGDVATRSGAAMPDILAMVGRGELAADIGRVRDPAAWPVRCATPGATSGAFDGTAAEGDC